MLKREITITRWDVKDNEVVKVKETITLNDEEYAKRCERHEKMLKDQRRKQEAGFNENIVNASFDKITEAFNEFMECLDF